MKQKEERTVFEVKCHCGYNRDHMTYFEFTNDPLDHDTVICGSTLNHYQGFWKRLLVAVKYLFACDNNYTHYTESMITKKEVGRLLEWLDDVQSKMADVE